MSFVSLNNALALNGTVMALFGPTLFFGNGNMVAKLEGKMAAAKKTKVDVMIWRLCGLWVTFAGGACLLATDIFFQGEEIKIRDWQWPLACLAVAIHMTEVVVKYQALGNSYAKFVRVASGNVALALVLAAGLLSDS